MVADVCVVFEPGEDIRRLAHIGLGLRFVGVRTALTPQVLQCERRVVFNPGSARLAAARDPNQASREARGSAEHGRLFHHHHAQTLLGSSHGSR